MKAIQEESSQPTSEKADISTKSGTYIKHNNIVITKVNNAMPLQKLRQYMRNYKSKQTDHQYDLITGYIA